MSALLAALAWSMLGLAELLLRIIPFSQTMRLGHLVALPGSTPLPEHPASAWARSVARGVGAAARRTPWRSKCFSQALVGNLLLALARQPRAIVFGVSTEHDGVGAMAAHAWLVSGDLVVTGAAGRERFTPVAVYLPRSSSVGATPAAERT